MLKAKTGTQDCYVCPSSWSGLLEDGRHWRARYRFGILRFTVDPEPGTMSVFALERPEVLKEFSYGDEYHGFMEFDTMRDLLRDVIDLSNAAPVGDDVRLEYDLKSLEPKDEN